jgi:hypothetical protein
MDGSLAERLDVVLFAQRRLGFYPDAVQERVLRTCEPRVLLNCTRQWGKSTVTAVKALHYVWTHAGGLVLVAAPSARQSGELIRKVKGFAGKLGVKVSGGGSGDPAVVLPNGGRVVGVPGDEGTIRGFSNVGLIVIDEAAKAEDALYTALRPMLAVSGGALWMLSTPRGRRGFFWEEWERGEGWEKIAVTGEECPRYRAGFLEREKRTMTEKEYEQEYCCRFGDLEGVYLSEEVFDEAVRRDLGRVL